MGKAKSPRRVGENEALAVGTTIRGSAQKLNLVAALIRGKKAEEAMNILSFSKKAMAVDAKKVLASAIANAEHNDGADIDELKIVQIYVEKGPILKRFTARAKGRGDRISKQSCHIYVTVGN